ncbi:sulfur carrier protein ThiS [Nocardioides daphniae]|uniref:Sulfur carrier protein ThiS n=1 Tax=Nocardioides daphniae TaxID=402297 RepID=A0A4V1CWA8_9ACTN|nr:sulfur carrier protein ThiS [Nocardioides daphniae]QCC76617.1 sulfur carrier protein ThiS [Nocardioides daphniae]GGD14687.1 hypothetical protein GCM10007231_12100 [Nocardioides daphniae]
MQVTLNGTTVPTAATTVAALLVEQYEELAPGCVPTGCAVALNGEVVPRSALAHARLRPSDRVEVVGAVAGG